MGLSGHTSPEALFGTSVAFTVLSGVIVVSRLLTRFLIARQAGLDDAFISVGFFFSLLMGIAICNQTYYGMGKHITSLSMNDISMSSAWFWAFIWLYYAGLYFTKMSILLQYLRIFPHLKFRRACYVVMGTITLWSAWAVFSAIFMCVPIKHFWHSLSLDDPQCLPRLNTWYANAAVNIVTDLATVILPLPMIKSLEIPRRQKMLLMGVFGLGFLTCFISVLRLVFIYPISSSPDATWNSPLANVWSSVELNVGIVCSCAPTLKGAIQRGFPKLLDSFRSTLRSGTKDSANTSASDSTQNSIEKIKIELNGNKEKSGFASFFQRSMVSNKSSNRSLVHSSKDYEEEEARTGDALTNAPIEIVTHVDQDVETVPANQLGIERSNSTRWSEPEGPRTTVTGAPGIAPASHEDDSALDVDPMLFKALGVPRN